VNFMALFKAFDAVVAFGDAVKRLRSPTPPPPTELVATGEQGGGLIEARLTSVVVAALKEAFDRDHARLELERAHLDEERRRAEEALRLEMRRQAVERELGRLRLIAGAAAAGWIVSVVLLAARFGGASSMSRAVLAAAWLLLIGSLGSSFAAQRHIGANADAKGGLPETPWVGAALWLLVAGLVLASVTLLF
jgi:hypothetical protein